MPNGITTSQKQPEIIGEKKPNPLFNPEAVAGDLLQTVTGKEAKNTTSVKLQKQLDEIKNSEDVVFMLDVCIQMAKDITASEIPENCKSILSDGDKLKNAIKVLLNSGKKKHGYKYDASNLVYALHKIGILTNESESIINIKKIFGEKVLEESIIDKEDEDKSMLKFLIRAIGRENYRNELGDKYKTPRFVNAHIKELKPLLVDGGRFYLLKNVDKINNDEQIDVDKTNNDEKFDIGIIKKRFKNKYVEIIVEGFKDFSDYEKAEALVKKYTNFLETPPERRLELLDGCHLTEYKNMKKVGGDVFEEYLSRLLKALHNTSDYAKRTDDDARNARWNRKNIDYSFRMADPDDFETHRKNFLKKYANIVVQDIYETKNEKLFLELRENLFKGSDRDTYGYSCNEFLENLSEENLNNLVRKIIKTINTKDDFEKFFRRISEEYSRGFYGIFMVIFHYLGDDERCLRIMPNMEEIPGNLYLDFVNSGELDIGDMSLPEKGKDIYVDSDDLEKLLKLRDELIEYERKTKEQREIEQERIERLRREKKNFEDEVMKNREKGDVIFNYTRQGQKYVLVIDIEKHNLQFLSEDLNYHSNIYEKYMKDKNSRCLGGGCVKMDDENKIITLYGYSEGYGSVPERFKESMKKMLEKKFQDHKIIM